MSKFLKVMIALVVIAGLAAPAMAEMKLNGYYRLQFISDNIGKASNDIRSKDDAAENQIDQRLRMKLTNTLSDAVSFVYYAEIDTPWGQQSKGAIGGGGQDGADGVNLETKNVYLDLKMGANQLRAGIQGYSVGKNSVVLADDMAGLKLTSKLSDSMDLIFFYSKFDEGDKTKWDDADLYSLSANVKLSDAFKMGADVIFFDNNGFADRGTAGKYFSTAKVKANADDAEVYYLNLDGDIDLGMAKLEAQFAYNTGTINKSVVSDLDISGYMASAKATANLGAANVGLRATYYSSDDDNTDNDVNIFLGDITGAAYGFANENLHIFFEDATYNNTNDGTLALSNAAFKGYGLMAVNATANFVFGEYKLNTGAGYFSALEDTIDNGATKKAGKELGFEAGAEITRKLLEKVDVSLIGGYAILGDFYETAANGNDPDDIYLAKVVMTVKF